MKEQAQAPPSELALRRGYEADTVSMRTLAWFGIIFVAFAIVSNIFLWILYLSYVHRDRPEDRPLSAVPNVAPPPPVPLQPRPDHDVMPPQDMQQLWSREDELFARLGWEADPKTHRVRIPDAVVHALAAGRTPATQQGTTRPAGTSGGVR